MQETFHRVERLARRARRSRSEVYSAALREYVARHEPDEVTEALNGVVTGVGEEPDAFVSALRGAPCGENPSLTGLADRGYHQDGVTTSAEPDGEVPVLDDGVEEAPCKVPGERSSLASAGRLAPPPYGMHAFRQSKGLA